MVRHKLRLVATGGRLKGIRIHVKSFDIDDSTDEAFDVNPNTGTPVIDTNGKAGNDNLTDYLNTAKPGQFWENGQWGDHLADKPFDATGTATFDFRVGMQPGNNYRVVASVEGETGYANVQVLNPAANTYLGPELTQTGGAISSEPLTVWRRLWVENDSMAAIPVDEFGYKRNDLGSDIDPKILGVNYLPQTNRTIFRIPAISDKSSFQVLDNGRIVVQSTTHPVIRTEIQNPVSDNFHYLDVSGDFSNVPLQSGFRLYDDDDFGLDREALPRLDLVNQDFKNVYKTGFIDAISANAYNPRKTVDFYRNYPLGVGPQMVSDGI